MIFLSVYAFCCLLFRRMSREVHTPPLFFQCLCPPMNGKAFALFQLPFFSKKKTLFYHVLISLFFSLGFGDVLLQRPSPLIPPPVSPPGTQNWCFPHTHIPHRTSGIDTLIINLLSGRRSLTQLDQAFFVFVFCFSLGTFSAPQYTFYSVE